MNKIVLAIKAAFFLLCAIATSVGGFLVGEFRTNQKMERAALAHECAFIDAGSLSFIWRVPVGIHLAMDAMPDVAPLRKTKGAKR